MNAIRRITLSTIVGLALIVSPLWGTPLYDNHTPYVANASPDAPKRASRGPSMRTKVIRYAFTHYDIRNARAFVEIIWRESRFVETATNESSGAYGLGQALPGSKMEAIADDWRTNPYTQLAWIVKYIEERYGSPVDALRFHDRKGWY